MGYGGGRFCLPWVASNPSRMVLVLGCRKTMAQVPRIYVGARIGIAAGNFRYGKTPSAADAFRTCLCTDLERSVIFSPSRATPRENSFRGSRCLYPARVGVGHLILQLLTDHRQMLGRFNANPDTAARNAHNRHRDIFADQNPFTDFAT